MDTGFSTFCTNVALLGSYLWIGDINYIRLYLKEVESSIANSKELWDKLHPAEQQRITTCRIAILANEIPNPWGAHGIPKEDEETEVHEFPIGDENNEDEFVKEEKTLNKLLYMSYDAIEALTGETKAIISSEKHVRYGRIDIDVRGPETWHAIELKAREADHKIVGQIMKYMRNLGSKLNWGTFKDVKGITVAKGYKANALLDLHMIGVKTFTYSVSNGNIIFKRVL